MLQHSWFYKSAPEVLERQQGDPETSIRKSKGDLEFENQLAMAMMASAKPTQPAADLAAEGGPSSDLPKAGKALLAKEMESRRNLGAVWGRTGSRSQVRSASFAREKIDIAVLRASICQKSSRFGFEKDVNCTLFHWSTPHRACQPCSQSAYPPKTLQGISICCFRGLNADCAIQYSGGPLPQIQSASEIQPMLPSYA